MFGPGLRLFKLHNVPVEISYLALLLLGSFVLTANNFAYGPASPWLLAGVGLGGVASIGARELAHYLVGGRLGVRAEAVRLELLGGATVFASRPTSLFKDSLLYLVGPLANLLLWQLCDSLAHNFPTAPTGLIFYYLANLNLFLAVLNFLPCYPLDGGQVAYRWLTRLSGSQKFGAGLITLVGSLLVADLVLDLTHILSRVYIGGVFIVFVAVLVLVSSINLVARVAFNFRELPATTRQSTPPGGPASQLLTENLTQARVSFDTGCLAENARLYREAIGYFSYALQLNPSEKLYLHHRAQAFVEMGDDMQALVDYCQLIEADKNQGEYYAARSALYQKLNRPQAARRDLERLHHLSNNQPHTRKKPL